MNNTPHTYKCPPSSKPDRSEGKSSAEVLNTLSIRDQTTAPQSESRHASPDASSSFQQRRVRERAMPRPPQYRETSIDDDLRGVASRIEEPHGVKRSRTYSSGGDESDDGSSPRKRWKDALLRELDDLEARTHGEEVVQEKDEGSPDRRRHGPSMTSANLGLALRACSEDDAQPTRSGAQSQTRSTLPGEPSNRGTSEYAASQ